MGKNKISSDQFDGLMNVMNAVWTCVALSVVLHRRLSSGRRLLLLPYEQRRLPQKCPIHQGHRRHHLERNRTGLVFENSEEQQLHFRGVLTNPLTIGLHVKRSRQWNKAWTMNIVSNCCLKDRIDFFLSRSGLL